MTLVENVPLLRDLRPADREPIAALLRATDAFHADEIDVALELVDAPREVGYRFVVAELDGRVAGYACFGRTPCTDAVWDLYWIAVDPRTQGRGVGRALWSAVERAVQGESARMLLVETASKPSYAATRAFYAAIGLEEIARVPDFYARGDDKIVYARRFDS